MLFLIRPSKIMYSYEFAIANSRIMDRSIRFICYHQWSAVTYCMKYEAHTGMYIADVKDFPDYYFIKKRTHFKSFPHD